MITKEMTMGEIIEKYPFASEIMLSYGLHCVGCHVNPYESLENGALGHGMSDEEIGSMLDELNFAVKDHSTEAPVKVEGGSVTITKFAADKVLDLMKANNATGALRISVARGGCSGKTYQMDFDTQKDGDFVIDQYGLKVLIDPKSMEFLNGTVIDYTEGLQGSGFKFENPNASHSCGCGKSVS